MIFFSFLRVWYRDYEIALEIKQMEEEIKRLEGKKIETLEMLQYVKSDEFIKDKARIDLNMVSAGEKVMVIKNLENNTFAKNNDTMVKSKSSSNLFKWYSFFINKNN